MEYSIDGGKMKLNFKFIISIILLLIIFGLCGYFLHPQKSSVVSPLKKSSPIIEKDNYSILRKNMVNEQIVARNIKDKRVIQALLEVERHKFVPSHLQPYAYTDQPLPIGEDQTISQPYIVALMTELLSLTGKEKVLEIGTGSGYQAAILSKLASKVYTIEIIESLAKKSNNLLNLLGYKNIKVKCGDGYLGWKEFAPYDAIIVTCAPPYIPKPLLDQLNEGGSMVIPVGSFYQQLKLIKKVKGNVQEINIAPVRFVPMTGNYIKK